ncbi:hypothetical protein IMCC3317_35040 [Kordia antarctica]|uniref:SGNH hydrolase-type esterase domain-containing protein n=1 Tax=Kordia antarctica TaxID=1218801 RepID=A0A7L4ZN16_9FLAO|nr:hypothetical protein [Kordia antarctica]QHI38118.1 hypothetical protein IMCC3317_35040 [Kordia antarctica]
MKYIRLVLINVAVFFGLLLILSIAAYFIEANRIKTFFTFTAPAQAVYFQPDSIAIFIHKPNIHLLDNWGTPEEKISTERRTNNLGFREDVDIVEKQPNEYRILVTGDSHTDGVLKHNTESFINIWEEKLNASDSIFQYNCMNGGSGFYTFRNYHGFLKKYTDLKPEVFLINVFTGNDFREAAIFEDDRTSVSNVYKSVWMRFRRKFQSSDQKAIPYNQGLEQTLFFESFPAEKERTMQLAQQYLLKIQEICKQENIRLIVTLLPSKLDVNPTFRKEVQTLHNLDDATMNINQELSKKLADFLSKENIEFFDLKPALQNATEKVYWDQDLHINENAHRIIGELLYEKVIF